jgi:hypothetical protein
MTGARVAVRIRVQVLSSGQYLTVASLRLPRLHHANPTRRSWRSAALAAAWRGVRRWAWALQALRAAGGAGTWGLWWAAWRRMALMLGLGEVSEGWMDGGSDRMDAIGHGRCRL